MSDKPHVTAALAKLDAIKTALEERTTDLAGLVGTLIGVNLDGCLSHLVGAQATHDTHEEARKAASQEPAAGSELQAKLDAKAGDAAQRTAALDDQWARDKADAAKPREPAAAPAA